MLHIFRFDAGPFTHGSISAVPASDIVYWRTVSIGLTGQEPEYLLLIGKLGPEPCWSDLAFLKNI